MVVVGVVVTRMTMMPMNLMVLQQVVVQVPMMMMMTMRRIKLFVVVAVQELIDVPIE